MADGRRQQKRNRRKKNALEAHCTRLCALIPDINRFAGRPYEAVPCSWRRAAEQKKRPRESCGRWAISEGLASIFFGKVCRDVLCYGRNSFCEARTDGVRNLADLGLQPPNVTRGVEAERVEEHAEARRANAERILARPEVILEMLMRTEAAFTRHDIARALSRYLDDPEQFCGTQARLEASPELVRLTEGRADDNRRSALMLRAMSGHAGQRRIGDESHRPRRVRFG
jgi:hypothetical protein